MGAASAGGVRVFFFFQAEDGIRDYKVTGVQTCALPISQLSVTVRAEDLPEGGVDPASLRRLAGHPRTRLVALSWVPTNSGLVQDVGAVGEVCAELDVPYLIDACQAVGQLAVDVAALRCDFLAGTGRKFLRGPRGIGFLYVSDRMLERGAFPLFLDMRGADWTDPDAFRLADGARRFENWEFAYALVAGLGAATRYALAVGSVGRERARRLAALLRPRLAEIPGVRVLDRGREQCAIVTVDVAGRDAADLKLRLRQRGIKDRKSTRLNSSHLVISYAVFCLKKKKKKNNNKERNKNTTKQNVKNTKDHTKQLPPPATYF